MFFQIFEFFYFFESAFIVPVPSLVDIASCVSAELFIKSVFEWFLEASRAPWFQERRTVLFRNVPMNTFQKTNRENLKKTEKLKLTKNHRKRTQKTIYSFYFIDGRYR